MFVKWKTSLDTDFIKLNFNCVGATRKGCPPLYERIFHILLFVVLSEKYTFLTEQTDLLINYGLPVSLKLTGVFFFFLNLSI